MQSIPKILKEKCRGINWKQLALKCAPYVIFGYVFNKVSWLYGQQAGDNTLQKVLDTINKRTGLRKCPVQQGDDLVKGIQTWMLTPVFKIHDRAVGVRSTSCARYFCVQPFASLLRLISRPNAWKSSSLVSWYILISPIYYFTFRV